MTINALRDIDWLITTQGRTNVRDALITAHEPNTQLDFTQPGYVVTSQLRLLCAVTAVALRRADAGIDNLRREGLAPEIVDATLAELAPACDPFDDRYPFLQRPPVPPQGPRDKAHKLGPGDQPVKKLSPSMPPDEAEQYWDLNSAGPMSLPLEDAILQLVVFHHLSMAGNNAYDGEKCQMGSPAMRFVGAGYAATEVCVVHDTLLDTLLSQIPAAWVRGTGLPAWADRRWEVSLSEESDRPVIHPLWAATWSSNVPACYWEDTRLTGVRTGGVPESWYVDAVMGTTKESRKAWWDARNVHDPFYLYMPDDKQNLKVQRLDFGVDGTQLAVQWAAEQKTAALRNNLTERVLEAPFEALQVFFARHQIEGTASSPNIRASEVFAPDPALWAFDVDADVLGEVQEQATRIERLHHAVTSVFRRKNSNERSTALVLDSLSDRRDDASNAFWRHVTVVYEDVVDAVRSADNLGSSSFEDDKYAEDEFELPEDLRRREVEAALEAFDEVANPHATQEPVQIAYVRGKLRTKLWSIANPTPSIPSKENQ